MSLNNVVLMGRLAADPELKVTPADINYTKFTLAVDRRFKKDEATTADFIDCVAWRQAAAFISKYFKKGSMIAVQGSLQTSTYTDKDGNKRKSYDVVVDNASFCGGKNDSSDSDYDSDAANVYANIKTADSAPQENSSDAEEDLPF